MRNLRHCLLMETAVSSYTNAAGASGNAWTSRSACMIRRTPHEWPSSCIGHSTIVFAHVPSFPMAFSSSVKSGLRPSRTVV